MPPPLIAAELFGHRKGAFPGAETTAGTPWPRQGRGASSSTRSTLPLEMQPRLLQALQGEEGRTAPLPVRLIAATSQDLRKRVAEGRFREDLFFRLAVFPSWCRPCGTSGGLPLARPEYPGRAPARGARFAPGALHKLESYDWPGNVRE
jgi:transcriptional regulator with GAF, ATPase, and Fis domain